MNDQTTSRVAVGVLLGISAGFIAGLLVNNASGHSASTLTVQPVPTQSSLQVEPTNSQPMRNATYFLQPAANPQ